jgi:site-specific DNA recombinase
MFSVTVLKVATLPSRKLVTGSASVAQNGWRLSAPEIERTVAAAAQQLLSDQTAISGTACNLGVGACDIPAVLEAADTWRRRLQSEAESAEALSELVDKVKLKQDGIELLVNLPVPVDGTRGAAAMIPFARFVAMRMKRRGMEMRLIIGGADAPRKPDPALLKAIALAHRWFEELASGRATSLAAIASREGVTDRYVARLIRLAFLAPKIVEAIAERGELANLKLTPHVDLPLDWTTQKRVVGIE